MAFDVYPATKTNPLSVGGASTSAPETFIERIAVGAGPTGNDAMFFRLVMLNPTSPCVPPGPDHPGIKLIAGGGTPVVVPGYPAYVAIFNSSAQYVAAATYEVEPNGVYLVTVDFSSSQTGTGNIWEIQIQNNAVSNRDFTWVVADSLAETIQPWMELPQVLDVDTVLGGDILLTGQPAQIALRVTNKGTGPLTINDMSGQLGGSDFEILSVPAAPINPNDCDDILIQFNAPASSGISTFDYNVSSNDTTATVAIPTATHNKRVALSGTAGKLEIVMVLDGSGSMAFLPDGSAPGVAESDMRWGHMRSAAEGFLDLLSHFAEGLGRVGIVIFPDIVSGVPDPNIPDSYVLRSSIDIPSNVQPIKDLLSPISPTAGQGNTPLGYGIGTAMGTAPGSYGEFLSSQDDRDYNPRWMVVMSDGAQNLGPDPSDFYGSNLIQTSFRGKDVKVIAVSYGDPGAVRWPPDPAQMEALRTESGGVYVDAGTNDTGLDPGGDLGLNVAKSFRAAVVAGLYLDPTVDPGVTLTSINSEIRRDVFVLPYDTKVCFAVNWATDNEERVDVQILTPDCQLITAAVAQADANIKYSNGGRYQMFTFNNDYLRNTEGGQSRDGTWTLVVSSDGLDSSDTEAVEYEIITQSRLRMRLNPGKQKYYAGDTVNIAVTLTLDGKPIHNASVRMRAETPGNFFNNWYSQTKVTKEEYESSKVELGDVELTSIAIKTHAIAKKGLSFDAFTNFNTITMTDPLDVGIYSASIGSTTVPGTYSFHVIATGETEDGITFRREQRLQMYLDVRPLPEFTLVDVVYTLLDDDRFHYLAEINVWPRDPFGNVVLVDPEINPSVVLTAQGGELTGPLVGNLDGSYTQKLRYSEDARPVFGLEVGGFEVIRRFETAPLNDVRYADKLIGFIPGKEAEKGANLHSDPRAALGDFMGKDSFVSLGAHGSITVGVIGESFIAQGDDDITVFIHSDPESSTQLRSYEVQAQAPGEEGKWVSLGQSAGTTQSFSLKAGGLEISDAIRIIDKSGIVLDNFKVSNEPGVSILGVGFKKSGLKPGGAGGCLGGILWMFKCLFGRHKCS